MITKMKKYDFLVFHGQYEDFLSKLREIGVFHVATLEEGASNFEQIKEKLSLRSRVEKQIEVAKSLNKESDKKPSKSSNLSLKDNLDILYGFENLQVEVQSAKQNVAAVEREIERMEPWGNYSHEQFSRLSQSGFIISFFTCSSRTYNPEWEDKYNAFIINTVGSITYFVTVTKDTVSDIEAEAFEMSQRNTDELMHDVEDAKHVLDSKTTELNNFAVENINNLSNLALQVQGDIDLDKVHINTVKAAESTVMVLEGYCPIDSVEALEVMLKEEGIFYESSDPAAEDNVPIKLRNNAFTRLFEPLTGMYGMPNYTEYDPTPILGPFFLLFFALCMGDSGYGILLVLFGLGVKFNKIKIDMFKGLGPIIMALGVVTFVVGFFLGTAFGIDLYAADWVPQPLKSVMIKGDIMGFDVQMVLSLIIGVVHICLAMVIKAICYTQRDGFMKNLSNWGWLILILGGLTTGILAMMQVLSAEATKIVLISIGVISALGIYIFNDPKRNPLINIGAGLWDTYNMATGLLGDTLSYIRLYALGLAGGMLGGAFNSIASMVLGDTPNIASWIGFIIILIIGHLLNLAMSALGAFVHPLRLTFVEYFKNVGYEGKGEKYAPFKTEKQQD